MGQPPSEHVLRTKAPPDYVQPQIFIEKLEITINMPPQPVPYERLAVIAVIFVVVGLFGYLVIRQNPTVDKFAGIIGAFITLALVAYMVINPQPTQNPNVFALVKIFASIAAAVFGGTIPGFLQISYETQNGFVISAIGALALFVGTYFFTPKPLPSEAGQGKQR